jgi:gamma-glutamylcyclotransferase (GGCT)/AIG2-like uncharacterized protein YtfP
MTQYLFVYGTLQPGCAPRDVAALAAKLRPVGEGFVRGMLYDLGRYPGAVPDARSMSKISGALMELPDDESFFRDLDAYEGFDPHGTEASEFVRETQTAVLSDRGTLECWFYRYNGELNGVLPIANGVWRK